MGGRKAQELGVAHKWTPEEAKFYGRAGRRAQIESGRLPSDHKEVKVITVTSEAPDAEPANG